MRPLNRYMPAWVFIWLAVGLGAQDPVKLVTYNIRLDTPSDGIHAWPHRKNGVVGLLKLHEADIFCVQEALHGQVDELDAAFPGFTYEGVGRDNGIRQGEFSAIFFRSERFLELGGGTFWLSGTPQVPGRGWDAAYPGIRTWVRLRDRTSGEGFYVFNTHFDHVGEHARGEPASLVTIQPPYGPVVTYHGFTYDDPPGGRIDYVFVSDGVDAKKYGVLTDSRDRSFFSDHLPVVVTLQF